MIFNDIVYESKRKTNQHDENETSKFLFSFILYYFAMNWICKARARFFFLSTSPKIGQKDGSKMSLKEVDQLVYM